VWIWREGTCSLLPQAGGDCNAHIHVASQITRSRSRGPSSTTSPSRRRRSPGVDTCSTVIFCPTVGQKRGTRTDVREEPERKRRGRPRGPVPGSLREVAPQFGRSKSQLLRDLQLTSCYRRWPLLRTLTTARAAWLIGRQLFVSPHDRRAILGALRRRDAAALLPYTWWHSHRADVDRRELHFAKITFHPEGTRCSLIPWLPPRRAADFADGLEVESESLQGGDHREP
jgi:hypothetical protein